MTLPRAAAAILLSLLMGALLLGDLPVFRDRIPVAVGQDLQAAIDSAPSRATLVLAAGTHPGPVRIDRSLALEGDSGAEIEAPPDAGAVVTITADGT
ncbi:MAG: hypothetical protein ACRDY4_11150, partial [Acidimicrobiia bacterium]